MNDFQRALIMIGSGFAFVTLLLLGVAYKAEAFSTEDLKFYHGVDLFHSTAQIKSKNDTHHSFRSFGGQPYIGVHLNEWVAIEGGYHYHQAETSAVILRTTTINSPGSPFGASTLTGYDNAILRYKLHGISVGAVLRTSYLFGYCVRGYGSLSLFPAHLSIRHVPLRGMNYRTYLPEEGNGVSKSRWFMKLGGGLEWELTPTVRLRAGAMFLKPSHVDLSRFGNRLFSEARQQMHVTAGLSYHWL